MGERGDRLREIHNRGEQDGAKGKYERPHGEVKKFFSTGKTGRELVKDNQGYNKGWENAKKQK